jgi:hypothetical protein
VRAERVFREADGLAAAALARAPASRFAEMNKERTAKRRQISVAASMPSPSPTSRTSMSIRSGCSRSARRTAPAGIGGAENRVPGGRQMRHQIETDEEVILHDDDAQFSIARFPSLGLSFAESSSSPRTGAQLTIGCGLVPLAAFLPDTTSAHFGPSVDYRLSRIGASPLCRPPETWRKLSTGATPRH